MMTDHSKLTAKRSGFVIRRGRRVPIEPAAAVEMVSTQLEARKGGDETSAAVVAAWVLCRAAWALDMGPVFLDGVGRLIDAPADDRCLPESEWQQQISDAVSASCRGRKPELVIADEASVTADEVRSGLLMLTDAMLDELGAHSAELAGPAGGSAEMWRKRYAQAVGW